MTDLRSRRGDRMRSWLYAALVLCYLAFKLTQLAGLSALLSVLSLVAILISLPASGVVARLLTVLFLVGGSAMLVYHGISWRGYLGAYGELAYLLALFSFVPVLSVPVKLGGYGR